jgi:hypothetical protein
MISKILLAVSLTLTALLTGCATNPAADKQYALEQMKYKLEVYGPACEKLGFVKDTDEWRTCIQRENEQTLLRQQNLREFNRYYPYYDPFYYRRR